MPSRLKKGRGISRAPRVAHAIFCDDIRPEMGNKFSLMGVYGPELQIEAPFPVIIHRFGVRVGLITDMDDIPEFMKISITLPNNTELLQTEVPIHQTPPQAALDEVVTKYHLAINLPFSPLPLFCAGFLEVWVETELGKIRAGKLKVSSTAALVANPELTDPTVSSPPSEQSQPVVPAS
jgi:hypothetical protein